MSEKRLPSDNHISKINQSDKIINLFNIPTSTTLFPNYNTPDLMDLFNYVKTRIQQNNVLFETLMQTNDILSHNVDCIQSLRSLEDQNQKKIPKIKMNKTSKHSQKLEMQLFGSRQYKYLLVLNKNLPESLYKGKNFNIEIHLVDISGRIIINSNPIPITLVAYDSCQTPEIILTNKKKQCIFNGNCESQIKKGYGIFEKLQFREVTSIYRQRWIYFVIYPKIASIIYQKNSQKIKYIDYNDIKPLILSEIIIKSKKK